MNHSMMHLTNKTGSAATPLKRSIRFILVASWGVSWVVSVLPDKPATFESGNSSVAWLQRMLISLHGVTYRRPYMVQRR